jgi:LuxR family maltose regulon positive regulatory protein
LDAQREWYRYHHLFAEMLRARLVDERATDLKALHLRAADWFESHGDTPEAIEHAVQAGAFDRAARMIKVAAPGMQQSRQERTLVGWYDSLPTDLVRSDGELGLGYAGALLSSGRTDGVDQLLQDAETAAGGATAGVNALRRGVALYRAARALASNDTTAAIAHSETAVGLAAYGGHLDRGSAYGIRGLIQWAMGDLNAARETWAISLDELEKAGHISDVLGGSLAMGDILIAQGRLLDAEELYTRGLTLAGQTTPPLRGAADMHSGLADVLRERGDLDRARHHLGQAAGLGEFAGLPQNRHRRRMVAARILHAEGRPADGIPLLDEAEALYTPDFFPEVQPIPALRARLAIAARQKPDAIQWMRRPRPAGDGLTYLTEFEHITRARVLLTEPTSDDDVARAHALLEQLLAAAHAGDRTGVVIELHVLSSLAHQRTGATERALDALGRAVALAEPEGYVHVFANEGKPLSHLLGALAKRTGDTPYLRRLRAAASGAGQTLPGGTTELLDPLSERELEVLRLLASELSGPEISRHLVVSVNTLRTHTKNIFTKLGATSRREAVRRATELGIL